MTTSSISLGQANPLVTVVLMAYNQEKFIRDAVRGALAQTYSPLEIIISDDMSTDNTWDAIQEAVDSYHGPHEIHIRRGRINLGINAHFNELVKGAKGEFIAIMAGDDVSLPNRVEASVQVLVENQCHGMYSNGIRIDAEGKDLGLYVPKNQQSKKIPWHNILKSAGNGGAGFSMCWSREIVDSFGDIPLDPLGEDAFIPFRSALLSDFYYFQTPLVHYREHGSNASFWFALQRCKDVQDRKETARKWIDHHLKRYEKWQLDAQAALQRGIISDDNYAHIHSSIKNMVWLYQQRSNSLNRSIGALLVMLISKRKIYQSLDIYKVGRREFQAYLSVVHPELLKALIAFVSGTRGFLLGKIDARLK